ncbi:MAG TPA: hypothetical protein VJW95_06580 [Dissulfurispiraceae bacterium]|nr:hypothetical protein [Dissulfurispiraceae bacterium]
MYVRLLINLALILALSFSAAYAVPSNQRDAQLTAAPDAAQVAPVEGKEDTAKIRELQEKEYWCKRSGYHRKRIEDAQSKVDKEAELLSELRDEVSMETGKDKEFVEKKINKTQDKLTSAQKMLRDRKSDLEHIEDEAQRKNIPSGWLQCPSVW